MHAASPRWSDDSVSQLLGIVRHLALPLDLRTLLAEITHAACDLLQAERSSVWLFDAPRAGLKLHVASDITDVFIPLGRGLAGACAAERQVINVADCYADARFDTSVDRRSGYVTRCSLSLPLIDTQQQLVGVLQVLNRHGGVFADADLPLAEALAAQCAVALARAAATEQLLAAEQVRQELALARVVQLSSLPRSTPVVPGYDMHATFQPAAETGGDCYDLAPIGPHLLMVLADATGHGIAPALSVTQMQAMLRMALRMGGDLPTAFAAVNDSLCDVLPDGHFVTAFIGLLDPASHRLQFISGGQGPILHYVAAEEAFCAHKANSFPMGLMPLPKAVRPIELDLAPGDVLVLATDGIFEYEDAAAVAYGRARLEAVVREHRHAPIAALSGQLLASVAAFAKGAPQLDDMTTVLLRRQAA
jgi:phosphoserine phosphatase